MLDGLIKSGVYLHNSGQDPQLRELLNYRVSLVNGCAYCLDMHHKELLHMGETEQRIHGLGAWRECPYYTDRERAVLTYADALTIHCNVEDEVFEALTDFYSKAEIADLTLAITIINTWNRINKAFKTAPGKYKVTVSLQ